MEFKLISSNPESTSSACQIVIVHQKAKLSTSGILLDKAASGYLSKILKKGDLDGSLGQSLILHNIDGISAERVLLVGSGSESEMNERNFNKIIATMVKALKSSGATEAHFCPDDISLKGRDLAWKIRQAAIVLGNSEYSFTQMKSDAPKPDSKFKTFVFNLPDAKDKNTSQALAQGIAISSGMSVTRDLGNLPGNVCTPTYIAEQAINLAKGNNKLKVNVLEEADMEKLNMGSLLSVGAGSAEPAKLITMEYKGGDAKQKPIVLVGKGVTFDTGGISIKGAAAMDEMKYDMCGGASVMGTLTTVIELNLPINVVGIIPTTENMPDGLATKPGDIVTSMSGLTIEILNTDAEGRLILCDALTYAKKFDPRYVIDIATLTGACIVALGKVPSAVLGNDDELIDKLITSGKQIDDKLWQLPLWDEYQDQLHSNFADIANMGGREAGTITASCFLSRFTSDYQWAHLDIAGTAWKSGKEKGATGRPVPLLTQFILDQI